MSALVRSLALSVFVAAAALTAGCQPPGASTTAAAKLYDVKGKVVALDREKKVVTLDHEDIPGLMKAMKMEFSVEDAKVLEGLAPGDSVTGKLKADGGSYVVTSLSKR
jgi:Cu/Ag efflux protein CusF